MKNPFFRIPYIWLWRTECDSSAVVGVDSSAPDECHRIRLPYGVLQKK